MLDDRLSKLCFDPQQPAAAAEYRAKRAQALDRCPHDRAIPQRYVGAGIASWTM